jgi:hypothetical protein
MTIYKAKFSKERLLELPADECTLFLSLAHLSNEIIALDKLILWSYTSHQRVKRLLMVRQHYA